MQYSQDAVNLIKKTRKLLTVATPLWNERLYIGYSHMLQARDKVDSTKSLTKKESNKLLERDLTLASKQLNNKLKTTITQNQFDALVCLVYDIGIKAFIASRILDDIHNNQHASVIQKFRQWSRYKKEPVYQLINSRKHEIKLYNKAENNDD